MTGAPRSSVLGCAPTTPQETGRHSTTRSSAIGSMAADFRLSRSLFSLHPPAAYMRLARMLLASPLSEDSKLGAPSPSPTTSSVRLHK